MKASIYVAAALGCLIAVEAEAGMFTTPAGVCKQAGFEGSAREDCVRRVYRERKSRFWKEDSPGMLFGPVGGLVSSQSYGSSPGLRSVQVEGEGFLVRVHSDAEATVRSSTQYKNIKSAGGVWQRAAEVATGCTVTRSAKDMDAMYVWLACPPGLGAISTTNADPQVVTAAPAAAVNASGSIADEIAKLGVLRDRGLLTEAEFRSAKEKLLTK